VTDQSQSPEQPDEQQAGDVPAALEPDAPTEAHPVIEAESESPAAPEEPTGSAPAEPPVPEPPAAWTSPYSAAPDVPASATDAPALATPEAFTAGRPEIAVGAAFAGGFVLALILKRLGR
jgi:hypothetical protein